MQVAEGVDSVLPAGIRGGGAGPAVTLGSVGLLQTVAMTVQGEGAVSEGEEVGKDDETQDESESEQKQVKGHEEVMQLMRLYLVTPEAGSGSVLFWPRK
jgi:hypothetical protein